MWHSDVRVSAGFVEHLHTSLIITWPVSRRRQRFPGTFLNSSRCWRNESGNKLLPAGIQGFFPHSATWANQAGGIGRKRAQMWRPCSNLPRIAKKCISLCERALEKVRNVWSQPPRLHDPTWDFFLCWLWGTLEASLSLVGTLSSNVCAPRCCWAFPHSGEGRWRTSPSCLGCSSLCVFRGFYRICWASALSCLIRTSMWWIFSCEYTSLLIVLVWLHKMASMIFYRMCPPIHVEEEMQQLNSLQDHKSRDILTCTTSMRQMQFGLVSPSLCNLLSCTDTQATGLKMQWKEIKFEWTWSFRSSESVCDGECCCPSGAWALFCLMFHISVFFSSTHLL